MKAKTMTAVIASTSLLAGEAQVETITFNDAPAGAPPPGWTATKTGEGEAKWTIEKDEWWASGQRPTA